MVNESNFQTLLKQLNAPYIKSEAYEVFGNVEHENSGVSLFWNSEVGYVVKYENARFD